MKLKSSRRVPPRPGTHPAGAPEPTGVPVVDGEPVEPYELPDDPMGNRRELRRMEEYRERRVESERTMRSRAVRAVLEGFRRRKGPGGERTFFNRWTLEWHDSPTTEGRRRTVEITCVDRKHMRGVQWNLIVELWRLK